MKNQGPHLQLKALLLPMTRMFALNPEVLGARGASVWVHSPRPSKVYPVDTSLRRAGAPSGCRMHAAPEVYPLLAAAQPALAVLHAQRPSPAW